MKGNKNNAYEQKRKKKKRVFASVLAIIIAVAMILGIAAPFMGVFANAAEFKITPDIVATNETLKKVNLFSKNETEELNGNFEVDVVIGFDDNYILEKTTPVILNITNNGETDFIGEVQIRAKNFVNSDANQVSVFYQNLELPKGATKKIFMDFQTSYLKNHFDVDLVDSNGNVVYKKKSNLVMAYDPQLIATAVLTDKNTQDTSYLENLELSFLSFTGSNNNYYTEYDKVFFLDKYSFPFKSSILENFKIIIVDDFNTSTLSVTQKEALKEYIVSGGYLAISTGENYDKNFSGLKSELEIDESQFKKVKLENGIDSKTVYNDYGKGKIFIHDFDFKDLPFGGEKETLDTLKSIYTSMDLTNFEVTDNYNYRNYTRSNYPYIDSSNLSFIFILLVVYIILVGPGMYCILKKKDKLEKAWYFIPLSAILFTVIIFSFAQFSIFKDGLSSYTNVVELANSSNYGKRTTYALITSPFDGDIKLTSENNIDFIFDSDSNYYYMSGPGASSSSDNNKEQVIRKIYSGEKTEITFYDLMKWESITAKTFGTVDMGGKIETNFKYTDGKLLGTITNNTNTDFNNLIIFTGKNILPEKELKKGETIEINLDLNYLVSQKGIGQGDYYTQIEEVLGFDTINEDLNTGKITKKDVHDKYQMRALALDYYTNYIENYTDAMKVTILAFNNDKLFDYKLRMNGSKLTNYFTNMYIITDDILPEDKSFEVPYGLIFPKYIYISNGHYDIYGNEIYAYDKTDVTVQFFVDDLQENDSFKILWEDENQNSIKFKVLNYTTGKYEEVTSDKYITAKDHADANGIIELKAEFLQDERSNIPEFSLKRGDLNA